MDYLQESDEIGEFDENLYSRQLGVLGKETMGKLIHMKVLLVGLRGVGIETAKNFILAGPRVVAIHDDEIVQIQDLGANFYLQESDVGTKTRAEACLPQLKELNEHVKVKKKNQFALHDHLQARYC